MDPFEEIRYLGWNLDEIEDFEYSPSHSSLSERLKKTLYLTEGRSDGNGISLPVANTAVEVFQAVSGSPLKNVSPRHVANLSKRSRVAPCTLLLAMIYARRLKTTNENYVQDMTSTDLLLVSMMVASKFLYDEGEDEEMFSDEWAKAANVDLNRVYELERGFLSAMDWNLFVHSEEFFEFIRQIETRIALKEGLSRGWFSYSDMEVLMAHPCWQESCTIIFYQALKVLGVCLAVYMLCTTSIIWSSMLLQHTQVHQSSVCTCLPLNTHPPKSTLMHHPNTIHTPPSPSDLELCHRSRAWMDDVNESLNNIDIGHESVNVSACHHDMVDYPDIWDMASTLHQKYHMAKQALVIFYQALLTALNDFSIDGNSKLACNDEEFHPEGNWTVCQCNCLQSRNVENVAGLIHRCESSTMEVFKVGSGKCQCGSKGEQKHSWNQTDRVGRVKGQSWMDVSQWYRNLWLGFRGGHTCLWARPSLKYRYVDLEMRFGTIAY